MFSESRTCRYMENKVQGKAFTLHSDIELHLNNKKLKSFSKLRKRTPQLFYRNIIYHPVDFLFRAGTNTIHNNDTATQSRPLSGNDFFPLSLLMSLPS